MKEYISIEKVFELLNNYLVDRKRFLDDIDFVVGVSRGGLIPASWIATHLNKPLVVAYIDKQDNVYLDRGEWLKGQRVLVVDDTVRTGATIRKINALIYPFTKDVDNYFLLKDINNEISFPWDIK